MADSYGDQHANRQALDELAALFLTPSAPAADEEADDDPADGFDPLSTSALRPARGTDGNPEPGASDPDPDPEAETWFTAGTPSPHRHFAGRSPSPRLISEALMLGHLPGFASPWIAQYAHALAERRGADIALIYLDGANVRLDVVRAEERLNAPPPPRLTADDLPAALAELAPRVGGFIIVVSEPDRQPYRRLLEQLPRWTVLTAADEAAVVGAYRLIKSLHAGPAAAARRTPRVHMAFAGCDDAAAADAMAKLSRVTAAHLGLAMQLAAVRKRIEPVRRHNLAELLAPADIADVLTRTLEDLTAAAAASAPAESAAAHEPAAPAPSPAEREATRPPRHRPSPTRTNEPPPLADYLGPAAATPLAARCPRCPTVEFATDAEGRLHLLRASGTAAEADAALRELIEARAWAIEHAALLALTCRDRRLIDDAPPRLHLFTAEPAPLLQRLVHATATARQVLTLHLLKPVDTASPATHVHAQLTG